MVYQSSWATSMQSYSQNKPIFKEL